MTPFSSKTVSAAMRDAVDLANNVAVSLGTRGNLSTTFKDFEEQMFARATKVQELTMMRKVHMCAADAMIGMMNVIAKAKGKYSDQGF